MLDFEIRRRQPRTEWVEATLGGVHRDPTNSLWLFRPASNSIFTSAEFFLLKLSSQISRPSKSHFFTLPEISIFGPIPPKFNQTHANKGPQASKIPLRTPQTDFRSIYVDISTSTKNRNFESWGGGFGRCLGPKFFFSKN